MKTRGYAVLSDVDPAVIGVSAPIFAASDIVTASLVLARLKNEVSDRDIEKLAEMAIQSTKKISDLLKKTVG